jgi:L-asparaginase/Glu-tRNA(Gln) amidotransferase subunit D
LLTRLQVAVKGIVLRTFGAGNAPDNNPDFLAALKEAHDMGIVIINTTQCMRKCVRNSCVAQVMSLTAQSACVIVHGTLCDAPSDGTVVAEYATGVSLGAAGVVSGGDMTVEAALTKLGCLLGRGLEPDVVRKKMGTVTRGERTMIVENKRFSLHDK